MLVLYSVAIREAHPSPRLCVLGMLRERGHTQGFTLQPKFTSWESLTPEPLLHQLLQMGSVNIPVTADDVSGMKTVIPQHIHYSNKKPPERGLSVSLLTVTH